MSSKATKQAILNADKAFKNFFKGIKGFPKPKRKKDQNVKAYFPKNCKGDWVIQRHRIKVPTIGWVRFKEYGYLPLDAIVKSGTVSKKANRYYVSILVEEQIPNKPKPTNEGIGIDLGVKNFAICSNGMTFKNINKSDTIKKIEKKIDRELRKLRRKYKNKNKGVATSQNIEKQIIQIQKLYQRINNIKNDYLNKTISQIIQREPSYIVIEDLSIMEMIKNNPLAKSILNQNFSKFRLKLHAKCIANNIELRVVDKQYPSSKICSCCGNIKTDLKLSNRIYKCSCCGLSINRDLNASINLKNAKEYKIA